MRKTTCLSLSSFINDVFLTGMEELLGCVMNSSFIRSPFLKRLYLVRHKNLVYQLLTNVSIKVEEAYHVDSKII